MWVLICVVIFFCMFLEMLRRPKLYPPGPTPLPILGNLLSLWFLFKKLKYHHAVCQYWSRQYGNLLGLQLGHIKVVVVSGRDMIKEVCSREVFDGRPNGMFYLMRSFGKKLGLVFSDGPSWIKSRRLVLKYLKNFGYSSRNIEAKINMECQALVHLRMTDANQPVNVNSMFDVAIVNILWSLIAGKRYDLKDEQLIKLCDLITRTFKVVDMSGGVLNFFPFMRHIAPNLIGYTELNEIHHQIYKFLKETIKQHRETIDIKNPRDVIDTFLVEMMGGTDDAFSEEELLVLCRDLMEAGVETVSNTVVFLMLHLLLNPDVQRRLQREIDDIIGGRAPSVADRARMVYTEAVVLEGLRISNVAAVGIPHVALENARLGNYVIPKGTYLLLAMYDLHNGDHWKEPGIFKPERFLTKEGNLVQDDWFMPFGTGRRRCIGEGLARAELFMFVTHLLQKFDLELPKGDPVPSTDPIDGVTLSAKPFRVIFAPRK